MIRNVATPIGIGVSDAKLNFAPWEAAARAETAQSDEQILTGAKIGDVVTLGDGRRFRKVGVDDFDEVD